VACVTPVRRLQGRQVTTLDGLPDAERSRWADATVATGGSQCGFCTPGILMRLAALTPGPSLRAPGSPAAAAASAKVPLALVAHLCRCTGWQTIEEAANQVFEGSPTRHSPPDGVRDLDAASTRAAIEGGAPQRVGPAVVLGRAGFADDTCPPGALVAVPDGEGGYAVGESVQEARREAGKVQGRSTTVALGSPVALPPGEWALTLQTTWVEPAYLEPDASWCVPGGEPASPYGNGGAFGGKRHSPVADDARRLADRYGRCVRVLWSREDVVRFGPKRPPVAGGIDAGGTGVVRVGVSGEGMTGDHWSSVVDQVSSVAPGLVLEPVAVSGPPTARDLRAVVWAEAAVLAAGVRVAGELGMQARFGVPVEVVSPGGGGAVATCVSDDRVEVVVDAGPVIDEVVLRSYCIGATHQALSWVRSEGVAVDAGGEVHDLTVRSFGILQARAMPRVSVAFESSGDRGAVNGSDAVFAAVAAARWLAEGLPPSWPTDRGGAGRR
jgi:xanthine dehydrogenase small subunit